MTTWITALLAALAGALGLAAIIRRLRPSSPAAAPAVGAGSSPPESPPAAPAPVPTITAPAPPRTGRIALAAAAGYLALMIAQALLLQSRQPVVPLLLFGLGGLLLWLSLGAMVPQRPPSADAATPEPAITPPRSRLLYLSSALFLSALVALLARSGLGALLLVYAWAMNIFIAGRLLYGRALLPDRSGWRDEFDLHRDALPLVALLAAVAGLLQVQTAPLSPQALGPVLLIPALYLLGWTLDGIRTGLFAAGLAAVSGWVLALGKADPIYITAAVLAALYLIALLHLRENPGRVAAGRAGFLLGAGVLIWPPFGWLGLLLPVLILLRALDHPAGLRGRLRAAWPHIRQMLAALLLAVIVALPTLATLTPTAAETPPPNAPANPQTTFIEGLSVSLLMFNLTTDPTPLHGLVHQPALYPAAAAAFLAGLLALAWRLYHTRRWSESLLLAALVIALIPSGLAVGPPIAYPHLHFAAPALPAALLIAGYGLTRITDPLIARLGAAGRLIVVAVFIAVLVFASADARYHYTGVYLPTAADAPTVNNP